MKICPVVTELFHAGGQTDMTKLTVVFGYFANETKKQNRKESTSFEDKV